MPFTVSHVAAVLPLRRARWPFSALAAGSMAPDLPYFVHLPVGQGQTHSIIGIPTIDLAMAVVAVAVWHALLAPAALPLAPAAVRRRAPAARSWPQVVRAVGWPLLLAACIVGAATHVAWDAFTHPGRWGTRRIGWLTELHGGHMGYTWAQTRAASSASQSSSSSCCGGGGARHHRRLAAPACSAIGSAGSGGRPPPHAP